MPGNETPSRSVCPQCGNGSFQLNGDCLECTHCAYCLTHPRRPPPPEAEPETRPSPLPPGDPDDDAVQLPMLSPTP